MAEKEETCESRAGTEPRVIGCEGWIGGIGGDSKGVERDGGRPPPRPSPTNCVGEGEFDRAPAGRARARSAHEGEAPPGELREPRAGLMAFPAAGFSPWW